MNNNYYTKERNVQIVLSILKHHGIKKVVASPGSTNIAVVASMQHDPFFEMYSCVDERSAAYMACGLAAESGEPVVLSCTGATASRNYYPALTEAYYRKLPILALTSSQDSRRIGHLKDQLTDRSCPPKDLVNISVNLQNIKDELDEWDVTIKANKAILELWHRGGGPSHINIETNYCREFSIKELPDTKIINRYTFIDNFPELPDGKIAVVVGAHKRMSARLGEAIDKFCENNNAVVFCDHTSGYKGRYSVNFTLANYQQPLQSNKGFDLIIHIGETSFFVWQAEDAKQVWRVSEDGELKDIFRKLTNVFEMPELYFFEYYAKHHRASESERLLEKCIAEVKVVETSFPDIPFSQIWIASVLHDKLPKNSLLHLGILAPIRSWNFFSLDDSVQSDCNQGGFGIDGNISTAVGAAISDPNQLVFVEVGDLSFFYDMNVLGNRHIGNNLRILIVNNGLGGEFRLFNQVGDILGKETDSFISAGGHYGNKSPEVVKSFVESLGYEYLSASSKDQFIGIYERFITQGLTEKPMVFEVFTNIEDENTALLSMFDILEPQTTLQQKVKNALKRAIGQETIDTLRNLINR